MSRASDVSILNQINPPGNLILINFHFNIITPSMSRSGSAGAVLR